MNENEPLSPFHRGYKQPIHEAITEARLALGVVAIVFLIVIISGAISQALAEDNCTQECSNLPPPPERKKIRYAKLPDSHRRAVMRMQPKYHRWHFTGWQPIRLTDQHKSVTNLLRDMRSH